MNAQDSDLLLGLASREPRALETLYDAHARSVYGYALAITRRPRDARRVLFRVFEVLARTPEAASGALSLRRHLLWLARPLAWSERSRWSFPGLRRRTSYALAPGTSKDLKEETERAGPDAVESVLLRELEGIDGAIEEAAETPSTSSASRGTWRPPPASLRSLVLLRAREAARPARRYVRWLLSWGLLVGALLLAVASEAATPALPDVPYEIPAGRMGRALKEELGVRRHLYWILEGFRGELK